MRRRGADEPKAELSMSPLIDCVFLLLIFFLVSSMTKKQNRDIDIDLPMSVSAEKLRPSDDEVVIGIDAEGNLHLDGVETTLTHLHTELRALSIENPDQYIRLDADAETPLHYVVEALDLCQFNNLQNVGIRTYDEYYNRR